MSRTCALHPQECNKADFFTQTVLNRSLRALAHAMLSTMRISEILQPAPNTKPAVGNNISSRNPDVEVMALTLSTMPLNMDGFNALDGGRGWVNSKFLILSVGAPGFSSVPYTHNKKSTEKEAGKRLYEVAEDGSTRLFSYEKGMCLPCMCSAIHA